MKTERGKRKIWKVLFVSISAFSFQFSGFAALAFAQTSQYGADTAQGIPYNNEVSSLAAENVQEAIDELVAEGIGAEVDTLDSVYGRGKRMGGANSAANAVEICDDDAGTNCAKFYWDATAGWKQTFNPEANRRTYIPTNKTWCLFDEEGDACVMTADPDIDGAGLGRLTMASGHQTYGFTYTRINVCQGGSSVCGTFTDLGASFVESSTNFRLFFDLSRFREFRISAFMSSAAVTGDIAIRCDADSTFGSTATLGTLDNPAANGNAGSWTAIPANECATAGGVWLQTGMLNGNGLEDPQARNIGLELR